LSVSPKKTELFIEGLKVGNTPQISATLMATIKPVDEAYINATFKVFGQHYAQFNPAEMNLLYYLMLILPSELSESTLKRLQVGKHYFQISSSSKGRNV